MLHALLPRVAFVAATLVLAWKLSAAEVTYHAAVWQADVPGGDPALVQLVADHVKAAGYEVTFLDSLALTNRAALHTNRFDLVALPNARILPVESVPAIEGFLMQGGDMLALGLPGWEEPRFRLGGRWLSREEYQRTLDAQRPRTRFLDFSDLDMSHWKRHTNDPQSPAQREIVSESGDPALHVVVGSLTSWDIVEPPALAAKFLPGETLTCFRAKGGPRTTQLALEWIEEDGSRWIASVDLSTNWQHHALTPEAFKPWEPRGGRGGAGDRLNVSKVARFTVGLALSHNSIELGRHEYWIADLGAAPNPFGEEAPPPNPHIPRLESFSPGYLVYDVAPPVRVHRDLATREPGFYRPDSSFTWSNRLVAVHPRPRNAGFDQRRPYVWNPVLEVSDLHRDEQRGAIGVSLVHFARPFTGSAWGILTPAETDFYRSPLAHEALGVLLARLRWGCFLVEGGCEFNTAFSDQTVRYGASAVNFSKQPQVLDLLVTLNRGPGSYWHTNAVVPPTGVLSGHAEFTAGGLTGGRLDVLATLADENKRVREFLSQVFTSRSPTRFMNAVELKPGGFTFAETPWKAHGVNYLPSSGIGVASDYFEHWLDRGAYDPEVIQRDLTRIRDMGMNAVSVFVYHRSLGSGHLLDFLVRCEMLGLKVNLSLRPGTPMDFRWSEMKDIIEHYRLADNDTVFAYDLAWEPSHYDENYQRKRYTQPWNEWVSKRYSSVEAAEKAWGVEGQADLRDPASGSGNSISEVATSSTPHSALRIPNSSELTRDGPWRKKVADYRRFLDELLAEKYAEARRLVKSVDPNHPVSFRMQFAGDPTFNQPHLLPYDFYGLRDAVDIWEPEAYGRIGDWRQVRPGHFTAAYARLCDPAKPVLWAEMGFDCWDKQRMAPSPQKLDFTARYYADFYRMLIESGADGVFFWWYPGGYRLNEQSDYGIINPDGTDRPVTRVIREWGAKFLAAPKPPPPTQWIEVDRDRDARGLPGIYEAVKDEYWRAVEQDRGVGLKWTR